MPSDFEGHASYVDVIGGHGIKPPADVYMSIEAARKAHPSLRAWADTFPEA